MTAGAGAALVLAASAALAVAAAASAALAVAAAASPEASAAQGTAAAESVTITTSKGVYYYGDHLSFTVDAPGYGGGDGGGVAYLYITHENGRTSSPVPIPLTGRQTVSTSPSAFQPPPKQYPDAPYPTGRYTLRIEHGGAAAETTFTLLDSGKIVIPAWIKDTTRLWAADRIGDAAYATSIGYLISNGIIDVGGAAAEAGAAEGGGTEGGVAIPSWVKQSAQWWIDGLIDDGAYGASLQYLLRAGVIVV